MRRMVLSVAVAALVVAVVAVGLSAFLAGGPSPVGTEAGASRATVPAAPTQARWVIKDLGTLGGRYSEALGVNDRGDVVGYSEVKGGYYHVFLWRDGRMRDLGPVQMDEMTTPRGEVYATQPSYDVNVNERGEVLWAGPDGLARLWANGSVQRLPLRAWISFGGRGGLNDRGQVIGSVATKRKDHFGNVISRAAMWENGKLTLLGSLPGDNAATLVNNNGQIVVQSFDAGAAYLWQNGRMRRIQSAGWVSGMNDLGQVILANAPSDGLMWQNGRLRHLGPIIPDSINNAGQVVGSNLGRSQALLWERGKLTSLTTSWAYSFATAINDRGQVLGGIGTTPGGHKSYVVWDRGTTSLVDLLPPAEASAFGNSGQVVGCVMTGESLRHCGVAGEDKFTAPFHAVLWTRRSG